jgi:hypothetical protein
MLCAFGTSVMLIDKWQGNWTLSVTVVQSFICHLILFPDVIPLRTLQASIFVAYRAGNIAWHTG